MLRLASFDRPHTPDRHCPSVICVVVVKKQETKQLPSGRSSPKRERDPTNKTTRFFVEDVCK